MAATLISYRVATESDATAATALLNLYLARRTTAVVREFIVHDRVILAEQGNKLVGVGIAKLITSLNGTDYQVFANHLPIIRPPVGVMELAAVHEQARHQGVGARLIERRLQWMREAGAQMAVCSALVHPDQSVPARTPLLRNGFEHLIDIPEFWLGESLREQYQCERCGNPCHCTASLYYLFL
jgi:GNAT superfamily N-acetyltransferase